MSIEAVLPEPEPIVFLRLIGPRELELQIGPAMAIPVTLAEAEQIVETLRAVIFEVRSREGRKESS